VRAPKRGGEAAQLSGQYQCKIGGGEAQHLQGSNCRGGQVIPWDFPGMHRIRGRSLEYPYKRSKCHEREKSIHGVFNTGTRGFTAPEDSTTAVCILPRTELAFSEEVKCVPFRLGWKAKTINFSTAIFRQSTRTCRGCITTHSNFPMAVYSTDRFARGSGGNGASASGTAEDAS
jgi:hypothetical protein